MTQTPAQTPGQGGPGRPGRLGPVTVSVPASSANLGPGFDCFGLALQLRDEVTATVTGDQLQIQVTGAGADMVACDERNLVYRALRARLDQLGVGLAGLLLQCRNRIPHGRGLGSSAAAIVAGITLADALTSDGALTADPHQRAFPAGSGPVVGESALELATDLEGHPDNVAACLFGGLTLAWLDDGRARASRLQPVGIEPAVFIPPSQSSTAAARAALPRAVPHHDAAFTAARAALLVVAMTGRPELLMTATEDRLHQSYRAPEMPESAILMTRLRQAGIAATISGAGSSVLALQAASPTPRLLSDFTPAGWTLARLSVAAGARLSW